LVGKLHAKETVLIFVPEGLTDRSLAIYCQEPRQRNPRPGGNSIIGFETRWSSHKIGTDPPPRFG
jgi:hypothetical protein